MTGLYGSYDGSGYAFTVNRNTNASYFNNIIDEIDSKGLFMDSDTRAMIISLNIFIP